MFSVSWGHHDRVESPQSPCRYRQLNAEDSVRILDDLAMQGRGAGQDEEHDAIPQIWAAFYDVLFSVPRKDELSTPTKLWTLAFLTVADSTFVSQLLTIPPYLLAASYISPSGVKYFRLFLRLMESSVGIGTLSWLANNLRGKYKPDWPVGRAIASIFRSQDAPRFIYGSTGLVAAQITAITCKHINTAIGRKELLPQQRAGKGELKEGGQGKRIGDGH
ncbi:hypothetical protein BU15DRAFT_62770 [Melanogaster broomeanus]|nr:hypothetical protein BU15DRAFT_62770 [Melanogaster broomeanus]